MRTVIAPTWRVVVAVTLSCVASIACREPPNYGAASGSEIREIDVLLVTYPGYSMCEERAALAGGLTALVKRLGEGGGDLRVAAVASTPETCAAAPEGLGTFLTQPLALMDECRAHTRLACRSDEDCAPLGPAHACHPVPIYPEVCIETPNGSVGTACYAGCAADADCPEPPSPRLGSACMAGECQYRPLDAGCPETLPQILHGDSLPLARCLAYAVPQQRLLCGRTDQGLSAVEAALAPMGDRASEGAAFRRPKADLLVVFMSNRDDCSSRTAIPEDDWSACGLLGDTDSGGPLMTVADFRSRLVDLAGASADLWIVAIAGDSTLPGDAGSAERAAYLRSKGDPEPCFQDATTICQGPFGSADWGRRYAELAASMVGHGLFINVCSDFASAFPDAVATLLGYDAQ